MFKRFIQSRSFFLSWLVVVVATLLLILSNSKGMIVLWINQLLGAEAFPVFQAITHLGEWFGGVLVFIIIILRYRSYAIAYAFGVGLILLVPFLLKEFVFYDFDRPIKLIPKALLSFPSDHVFNKQHSFPSGHTSAAFFFFSFLASILVEKRGISFLLFVCAFSVGLSRIVLVQHFLIDVVAGSFLGVILAQIALASHVHFIEKKEKGNELK